MGRGCYLSRNQWATRTHELVANFSSSYSQACFNSPLLRQCGHYGMSSPLAGLGERGGSLFLAAGARVCVSHRAVHDADGMGMGTERASIHPQQHSSGSSAQASPAFAEARRLHSVRTQHPIVYSSSVAGSCCVRSKQLKKREQREKRGARMRKRWDRRITTPFPSGVSYHSTHTRFTPTRAIHTRNLDASIAAHCAPANTCPSSSPVSPASPFLCGGGCCFRSRFHSRCKAVLALSRAATPPPPPCRSFLPLVRSLGTAREAPPRSLSSPKQRSVYSGLAELPGAFLLRNTGVGWNPSCELPRRHERHG